MTKIYALAFAAAVTAAVLAVPVYSQDIVVTSSADVARFVKDVSSNLDRELARETRLQTNRNGYAIVRFRADKDGRPQNVTLYRSSGEGDVNRAAQRVVGRLKSLHPLPSGIRDDQLMQANIIIARTPGQYRRLVKDVRRHDKARLASPAGEHHVLAFSSGINTGS